ncbi:BcPKS20, polyketide synthase [Aspergillus eucalypticola CBS 122712]|uniref:BcPKS20, polyketide synthase n=1 Tax=Aspergillus eucalypticola (strain CBS 122712 / IBT 29274) TaxID=1448314 RepID=A0A317VN71_ASPEC|nr:BcPKS20, polyketide synthase [Aspergillus eucalypticola CBS 122712]PWY75783.1 BcPKS20, polyketide synthase [Aspergillus eucalypticola CBS 122712]
MNTQDPFHKVTWKPAALSNAPITFQKIILVLNPNSKQEDFLVYKGQLIDAGYTLLVVKDATEIPLHLNSGTIIVHLPKLAREKDSVHETATESCNSLIAAARILSKHDGHKVFTVVTTAAGIGQLGHAPLYGLARVLKMEMPNTFGGLFEAEPGSFPLDAIKYAQGFDVVRICHGVPHIACLQPFPEQPDDTVTRLRLRPESTYLITGGTRGMGLKIAAWMGKRGAGNIILAARHGLEKGVSDGSNNTLTSHMKDLQSRGVTVHVLSIDLALPEAEKSLRQAIDPLHLPPIKGVVHAAGVAQYNTLDRCAPSDLDYTMAPKARGALALDALFSPGVLDFFLLTSSVGQLVGFPGQLTYAPANAFLDEFAVYRRQQGDACTSIQWTSWRGVGLVAQNKSTTRMIDRGMQARGIEYMAPDEALATLDRIVQLATDHVAVVRAVALETGEPVRHPILQDITPRKPVRQAQWKYPAHAVAVVGLACRTAAGDTADDLWDVIRTGQTTVREIDARRFPEAAARKDTKLWGNFLPDPESFDHGFFGKSKRESAALDPHQRLLLETTYHALESAGWLAQEQIPEKHNGPDFGNTTGCFIGMNAPDYPLNLGSHAPSPYTGVGMMRSFVAGRLSHHFGWTGPSHVIDTACSSAMVAIHQACRALQAGDCTRAVAGGVNLITNSVFFGALRSGGFLSETGACKTFDARADGYCRGEAVGVLVLKPLSQALQDGDEIRGILLGTGENQNINNTSITNPVLDSQTALYRKILAQGGISSSQVSYVEAHGTGTRAGDPIEVEGIRQVLGGPERDSLLHIGGIKANIGHSEGASGVISLIKVLLMMKYRQIPPQANFERLNPNITALESNCMAIPTSSLEWHNSSGLLVAMVNSYGASGSNAAALVASPPPPEPLAQSLPPRMSVPSKALSAWPVSISAASAASIRSYCQKLRELILQPNFRPELGVHLGFALSSKQNRQLGQAFATTVTSVEELDARLSSPERYIVKRETLRQPIVLLFSGQNGNTVPAAQPLYRTSIIFRNFLHSCNEVIQSLRGPNLFPSILDGIDGSTDIVFRHAAMFAIQYSSGMTWLECGLKPDAVCGHSFGEWAAMTVSGALTLEAGLKLVIGIKAGLSLNEKAGRASIIKKYWGPDPGAMIAIETDLVGTQTTASQHLEPFRRKHPDFTFDIACYNGPNNYVVAGRTSAMEALETDLIQEKRRGVKIRFKMLRGMHAYHSVMADSILDESARLSATIPIQTPTLPFETCHKDPWTGPGTNFIARNTRGPVFFSEAIYRIVSRLGGGPCIFLEAGIGGPVVSMARNALSPPLTSSKHQPPHTFVAIDGKDPVRGLAEAVLQLWQNGHLAVQFWPFHSKQRASYQHVTLPQYQFEKHSHWLEHIPVESGDKDPQDAQQHSETCPHCGKATDEYPYITLEGSPPGSKDGVIFRIDPRSPRYQELVKGHVVVGSPISPAAMYLELVHHAVVQIEWNAHAAPLANKRGYVWVQDLEIMAPLGLDLRRPVLLRLDKKENGSFKFQFSSSDNFGKKTLPSKLIYHANGIVSLQAQNTGVPSEFSGGWARLTRLLEEEPEMDELRGPMVYKVFSRMVKYSAIYRGLRLIVGKGEEAAGVISMPLTSPEQANERGRSFNDSIADPLILDNFMQVPGAFVHSLRVADTPDDEDSDMSFICTGMGSVGPLTKLPCSESYRVYAKILREDQKEIRLDLLAFDADSATVVWTAQGLSLNAIGAQSREELQRKPAAEKITFQLTDKDSPPLPPTIPQVRNFILDGIQTILSICVDVPCQDVSRPTTLRELGTDSLVSPEILSSIRDQFDIEISANEFTSLNTVGDLCDLVRTRLGRAEPDDHDVAMQTSDPGRETTPEVNNEWQEAVFAILSHSLEVPVSEIRQDSVLEDLGVDSLITPEIINNIKESLNVELSSAEFSGLVDVDSLLDLLADALGLEDAKPTPTTGSSGISDAVAPSDPNMPTVFQEIRRNYDAHAKAFQLSGYWENVYPVQLQVVSAFILEAFKNLGCPIRELQPGKTLPLLQGILPKYHRLVRRLHNILVEANIIRHAPEADYEVFICGPATPPIKPAAQLSQELMEEFPVFASTHGLPDLLGPHLAEYLIGHADPVSLLFGSERGRHLLEEFHANAPDIRAATQVLCDFVSAAISAHAEAVNNTEPFHILEVGAGTGGTTKHLVPLLQATGIPFTYTFTDLSVSLLARAKRSIFAGVACMEFRQFDLEAVPEPELHGHYHLVISANCVHATRDLRQSLQHIRRVLRPDDGCVALLELTEKLPWYDLVWGLLDGWWLFDDGRDYPLQSPHAWERMMHEAGFPHVDWSESVSQEKRGVQVVCGFTTPASPKPWQELQQPLRAPSTLLHRGSVAMTGQRNLFLMPDGFGSGAVFTALAPYLARVPDTSAYALSSPFLSLVVTNRVIIDQLPSIEVLSNIYMEEIKKRQPTGPYLIGGYSLGGVVAFEAARQLVEAGEIVERLVLIDSASPSKVHSFPDELVQFLDAIDATNNHNNIAQGTVGSSVHFTLSREQLRQYRMRPLRGLQEGLIQDVVLFSAREGVDKQEAVPRPKVGSDEQSAVEWFLDDRVDDGALGWEDLLDNVRVIRVEGNHFSLMDASNVSSWGPKLADILVG